MIGYIDIHSHLLPGIDDGAKDFHTSMEMFRIAEKNGISQMILTPHYKPMHHNASPDGIAKLIEQLNTALMKEKIHMELYVGNELYYSSDIVSLLDEGKACSLANSSYVLVEFGPIDGYEHIRNGIYQMIAGGYRPVLAHAERYDCLRVKPERIRELVGMGCYIQLNAGSILGQSGFGIKRFAKQMLKKQLVHFVATDAHNAKKRAPHLLKCGKYINRKYGWAYARALLYGNPIHVIRNEDI